MKRIVAAAPLAVIAIAIGLIAMFLLLYGRPVAAEPQVIATIPVGWNGPSPRAWRSTPTTNLIYVANWSNNVSVIDGDTNTVVATVPVGGARRGGQPRHQPHLRGQRQRPRSRSSTGTRMRWWPPSPSRGVEPCCRGGQPRHQPHLRSLRRYSVSVIDGGTNTVVATVPVGTWPDGVAVNPTTNRIYVANCDSNNVSVIDGATNTVVATVPVGS